jgi:hypothetical protein
VRNHLKISCNIKMKKSEFAKLLSHYIKAKKRPATQLSKYLTEEFGINISRNAISGWKNGKFMPRNNNRGVLLGMASCFSLTQQETDEFIKAAGFEENITSLPAKMRPTTRPIIEPNHFFGRRAILEKISNAWKRQPLEHIAIYGKKRSGKTSLLNHMKYHPELQGYNWVFIDFEHPLRRTLKELLCYVLEEIKLKISEPKCYLSDFVEIIEEQLETPTVILMENVEKGLQSRELNGFWEIMQHMGTHIDNIGFCVTSCQSLFKLEKTIKISDHSSHFINIFSESKLGPFTKEEACELLSRAPSPFSEQDALWVLKILENKHYWPILLQELIWARLDKSPQNWKPAAADVMERYGFLWAPDYKNTQQTADVYQTLAV